MVPSPLYSLNIWRGSLRPRCVLGGASPGPGRIGKRGCVATQSPWLTCVPLEGWIEEWTSKVTPASTCLHPAHGAELLSLSSKRQSSSWMVRRGFPVSVVATLTQWSLGDMRETRTTDRERDVWDCRNFTFTVWVVPPKMAWPVKTNVIFFFLNLVGVFSTSVLNHLSASLVQLCRRNAYGMSDVGALCHPIPGLSWCTWDVGESPQLEGLDSPWRVEEWSWMYSNHYP